MFIVSQSKIIHNFLSSIYFAFIYFVNIPDYKLCENPCYWFLSFSESEANGSKYEWSRRRQRVRGKLHRTTPHRIIPNCLPALVLEILHFRRRCWRAGPGFASEGGARLLSIRGGRWIDGGQESGSIPEIFNPTSGACGCTKFEYKSNHILFAPGNVHLRLSPRDRAERLPSDGAPRGGARHLQGRGSDSDAHDLLDPSHHETGGHRPDGPHRYESLVPALRLSGSSNHRGSRQPRHRFRLPGAGFDCGCPDDGTSESGWTERLRTAPTFKNGKLRRRVDGPHLQGEGGGLRIRRICQKYVRLKPELGGSEVARRIFQNSRKYFKQILPQIFSVGTHDWNFRWLWKASFGGVMPSKLWKPELAELWFPTTVADKSNPPFLP